MITLPDLISCIKDMELRQYAIDLSEEVDVCFNSASASSTNKYHPEFARGDGGLRRHTVVVAALACEGLQRYQPSWNQMRANDHSLLEQDAELMRDVVLIAAIFHDAWKNGRPWGKYTHKDHGNLAAEIMESGEYQPDGVLIAAHAVRRHMGIWCKQPGWSPLCENPSTQTQVATDVLQEADYYASRSCWAGVEGGVIREMLGLTTAA